MNERRGGHGGERGGGRGYAQPPVPTGVDGMWSRELEPRCYSDHSSSDSQAWIMNISEDFDVRVEIYQQIQWGRNIKCQEMPASCQPY